MESQRNYLFIDVEIWEFNTIMKVLFKLYKKNHYSISSK
jgi:hypothetical protein